MSDQNIITFSPTGEVRVIASNKVAKWYLKQPWVTDGEVSVDSDEVDDDREVEYDEDSVGPEDPYEDAEDIRRGPAPREPFNSGAKLTPALREVWREMVKHPQGAHYSAIAEELGIELNAINARCCALVNSDEGWAIRQGGADSRSGVYVPIKRGES